MNTLRFETQIDDLTGFRADAVLGDTVFQALMKLRDLRRLRVALLEMARIASEKKSRHCILLLDDPAITETRVREEWEGFQAILKTDLRGRLALVIHREDTPAIIFGKLKAGEHRAVETVVDHVRRHAQQPVRRSSEAFFDILRVLLVHWIRRTGPISLKELGRESGFSYPTIAGALEKLEQHLTRHSDRSVELRSFPHDAWFKLVAQASSVRSSVVYADRSGRPRPPSILQDRLRELRRGDVAVSGVLGARHYVPGLDLTGTPRLDIVHHTERLDETHDWILKLDPALKPAERGEAPQVVVHTLVRPVSFFMKGVNGILWADEIECLLDLHEARLEPQALEFLERITSGLNA